MSDIDQMSEDELWQALSREHAWDVPERNITPDGVTITLVPKGETLDAPGVRERSWMVHGKSRGDAYTKALRQLRASKYGGATP